MLQHLKGYQKSITLIKTGHLNKKNTNINTSEKRKETGGETNINMCNLSASTNTSEVHNLTVPEMYCFIIVYYVCVPCRPMLLFCVVSIKYGHMFWSYLMFYAFGFWLRAVIGVSWEPYCPARLSWVNPVYIHRGFFITVGHKSTTILTYSERIGMQCY